VRLPAEPRLRRRLAWCTVAAVAATATSCGGDDESSPRPVVEVFGPIVGDSGAELAGVLRDASADSTVELRYVGVTSFNEQLEDRLARGDRPGVALLSQPGLLTDLVERSIAVPLPEDVAAASAAQVPTQLVELVGGDAGPTAVWLTIDIKGLVWYRPAEFSSRGIGVPTTLDELADLSERIRTADDAAPWCLTMEAGASTGWVGTDWVEDYVLRRLGPTDYAEWTTGELRFDSPEIASIFAELDTLLRAPGAVAGGQRAILTVPWERTADLLAADAPTCLMAHQGDFLRREFPSDITVGTGGDVDFFQLPGSASGSAPLLVGGLLATPLVDAPETATAMEILSGTDVAERLDRTGEFLSPHRGVDASVLAEDTTSARLLELVDDSTDVQFDGSDLMPVSVGTGTFWTEMRAFFAGEPLGVTLVDIDAGWPPPTDG
jgi:alpha-glucoside transport system substrate-binding protein